LRQRGFTTVELIVVMVLIGIMAAVLMPRLIGNGERGAQAFGDQLVSGLRLADSAARARRRLVCASLGAKSLTLRVARTNPPDAATPCPDSLPNAPDSDFATTDPDVAAAGLSGTLYFQPNGDISADLAGATLLDEKTLTVSAQGVLQRTIKIDGRTGYVE
jgi:MSHA pilin protein MshC